MRFVSEDKNLPSLDTELLIKRVINFMMICIGAACKDSSSMTNKICFMLYVRSRLSPDCFIFLEDNEQPEYSI